MFEIKNLNIYNFQKFLVLIFIYQKYVPPEDTASELKKNSLMWSNLCGVLLCKGNLQIGMTSTKLLIMFILLPMVMN